MCWNQHFCGSKPIKTPSKHPEISHKDLKHRVCNMIFLGESYGYGSNSSLSFLFTPKYVYFIWLVVYLPLWKYEFVSWEGFGRIIPYMKWTITFMFQTFPNHQPVMDVHLPKYGNFSLLKHPHTLSSPPLPTGRIVAAQKRVANAPNREASLPVDVFKHPMATMF